MIMYIGCRLCVVTRKTVGQPYITLYSPKDCTKNICSRMASSQTSHVDHLYEEGDFLILPRLTYPTKVLVPSLQNLQNLDIHWCFVHEQCRFCGGYIDSHQQNDAQLLAQFGSCMQTQNSYALPCLQEAIESQPISPLDGDIFSHNAFLSTNMSHGFSLVLEAPRSQHKSVNLPSHAEKFVEGALWLLIWHYLSIQISWKAVALQAIPSTCHVYQKPVVTDLPMSAV